jgi:hypothetical protein
MELGTNIRFCKPVCQETFHLIGFGGFYSDIWKKISDYYSFNDLLSTARVNRQVKNIIDNDDFRIFYINRHRREVSEYFNLNRSVYSGTMAKWIIVAIPIIQEQQPLYFIWACRFGRTNIAQMIDIDPSIGNNEAIRRAASNGHIEIVQWLLSDPRVDPTDLNNDAICIAAQNGYLEVVKILATRVGYPQRALESAIVGENIEMIRYLLNYIKPAYILAFNSENRAIIELFYNDRITFQFAIEHKFITLLELLMERRDPSENDNYAIRLTIANVKLYDWSGKNRTMTRMLLRDPRVRAKLSKTEIAGYDRIFL